MALANPLRRKSPNRAFTMGVVLALPIYWLISTGPIYIKAFETQQTRKIWEYSDLLPVAQKVQEHTGVEDRIYIFPDTEATSNLYYLSQRFPPEFWIFNYPWYLTDRIKAKLMPALEAHQPDWIIYFPGNESVENSAPEIMNYIETNYQREILFGWAQGQVWLLKRKLE
jgi:hypothetical protein